MRRGCPVVIGLISLSLVTGCWDQTLLKDVRLIIGLGIDEDADGNILDTFVLPDVTNQKNTPQVISVTGHTARETRLNLGKRLNLVPDGSKNRFVLIGEEMATKKIYTILDVFYRDPKSALNAKIAVVKGRAEAFMKKEYEIKPNLILNLDKQIVSAETASLVPNVNIQSICTIMFDPGQDFVLPYIEHGTEGAVVTGIALFNSQTMTGALEGRDAIICLLLANQMGKRAAITVPAGTSGKTGSFMTFQVFQIKRNLQVWMEGDEVFANIDLQLKVKVEEFAEDHLVDRERVEQLNARITKELNRNAQEVIRRLQQANCDIFGIGRRLIAFHHDYWKKTDWNRTYPHIKIQPSVMVEIARPGIIY
ncbi:Ger(x)C family spore germination protein [Paenibacillus sp. H1-7]|uniref:Ger(x)C family spore germination protein n=1 Tax=Paenibacillus sp. H1-7 TaxID=2282849 RepID=UPI001EF833D1|nr:Ger(x)C family spore germination protein [Paenibacillus sp. H1-7]ULL13119.1 Ger(x)C family spore germination protein [Paenibacillus sp. H1-7]